MFTMIKWKLFSFWKYENNDHVHGTLIINIFSERVFFPKPTSPRTGAIVNGFCNKDYPMV